MERFLFYMNLSGLGVAAFIFFLPFLPTISACSTTHAQAMTPKGIYSSTYVAQIKTPLYGNDTIVAYLKEFNAKATKPIVKFDGTDDDRPIIIQQHHFSETEDSIFALTGSVDKEHGHVLGLTTSDSMYCLIFLGDDMYDDETLRETVIHEYLHCFGWDHTPKDQRHDLMNATQDLPVPEENYKEYAHKLEVLIYGQ